MTPLEAAPRVGPSHGTPVGMAAGQPVRNARMSTGESRGRPSGKCRSERNRRRISTVRSVAGVNPERRRGRSDRATCNPVTGAVKRLSEQVVRKRRAMRRRLAPNTRFRIRFMPTGYSWTDAVKQPWRAMHDTVIRNRRCRSSFEPGQSVDRCPQVVLPLPGNVHGIECLRSAIWNCRLNCLLCFPVDPADASREHVVPSFWAFAIRPANILIAYGALGVKRVA